MKKEKKISIIMGVYNCGKTIKESIDSILNQTYNNWQFIICDDCSSDDTLQIVNDYKEKYPGKFIVIKNDKNLGLNKTLNRCLSLADGDYIARMDGDDISIPSRFEKEVNVLENHSEYAIVSCHMITFDDNGDWGVIKTIETPQSKDFPKHVPVFCHAPCMIRKEAFESVNGYTEDKKLLRVEDYHLWFKLYAKGFRGYNIQEPLYKMRDDRNALHRRTFSARMNGVYATFIGYHLLKLPFWMYYFAIKNLIVELIKVFLPDSIYELMHKHKLKD